MESTTLKSEVNLEGLMSMHDTLVEEIRTLKIELGMLPAEVRLRGREGERETEADSEKCLMVYTNMTYI